MFSSRGTVRYEERGQGYRDVEKVGKHCTRPTLEISELWICVILDRRSIPGTARCHVQTGSEAHRPYYTAATDANGAVARRQPQYSS
jgi:hypothetical protein